MLKKEEWLVLGVFLLLVSLFIFFNNEGLVGITGMASVSEPSFDVVLTKTEITSGEEVEGIVNITFTGPFDPLTKLKVEFDDIFSEVSFKNYFKSKNISFTETEASASAYNPSDSKSMNFESSGSKEFAFKLPALATVDDFTMTVTGSAESAPRFVSFDVEEYTGKKEWKYFGNFVNFNADYVYPKSLSVGSPGNPANLNRNETYYCEVIELPESKHFRLGAKLKKNFLGADIKAVLLSFDGEYASGGAQFCDIIDTELEVGADPAWYTCDLTFDPDTAKQGTYLVCVYYEGDSEKSYYELSRDLTSSDSRFNCPRTGVESLCLPSFSEDYFIGAKTANYTGVLDKGVSWAEGVTDQDMEFSLIKFLEECKADEIGYCVVPFSISSESAGTLQVSGLRIDYTEGGGASSYSGQFYEVAQIPGRIVKLGGVDLEKGSKTIEMDLSRFNLTAPSITDISETFYLEVDLIPGGKVTKPVKVFSEGYVPETGTIEEKITKARSAFSDMQTEHSEVLDLFGIEVDVRKLSEFESEVNKIKANTNLSIDESNSRLSTLANQIDTYLEIQPKSFGVDTSFKDLYIPEPGDVEKVVPEEEALDDIYFYQDNVEVSVELLNYVLERYDKSKEKYSMIKKTIIPQKTLSNVYVYEIIPKTLANNVANILFKNKDYEILQPDPIVRYTFTSLSQPTTIEYGVKDVTTTLSMLSALGSIIVPKKVEEVVEKEYECGDSVCTDPYEDEIICPEDCGGRRPIPWVLIIVLVVLLIAGVVYINFYKGKGAFRKLVGKPPFSQPKDLENIKNYIKAAKDKGIKNQNIANALLKSGWAKNQIVYAFEDLKWDEKRLFTIRFAPGSKENVKKLQTFIKKCLQLNIPPQKIMNVLVQKGWDVRKVNEVLASVGKPQEKVETEKEKKKKISFYFEKTLEEEAKK